MNKDII